MCASSSGYAGEFGEKLVGGVDADNVEAESLIVVENVLKLVFAQQSVVDKNAGEAVADGLVKKDGDNRRVDTAAQAEDHAVVAELTAEFVDG